MTLTPKTPLPWSFTTVRTRVVVRDAKGELLFVIEGVGRKNPGGEQRRQAAIVRLTDALNLMEMAGNPNET